MSKKSQILERLATIRSVDGKSDLVSAGRVSEIIIAGNQATFSISCHASEIQQMEQIRGQAQKLVEQIDGIDRALVVLTEEIKGSSSRGGGVPASSNHSSPNEAATVQAAKINPDAPKPEFGTPTTPKKEAVKGVKFIVAIGSGKGGVGKSTTSCNIALGLQAKGLKVGLLDADIYGPSQPKLLGISGRPNANENGQIMPLRAFGLKVMSMGLLVDEDSPVIWRGPMVMSAVTQMFREVDWGELDVLVVDLPPGTGDVQLTMAQRIPVSGAVIVSTPQDLALIDARKGLAMFNKLDVPVLGIVENMSYYICPHCGERGEIFAHGGAKTEAQRLNVSFLGAIPLHQNIRKGSDQGTPIIISDPECKESQVYGEIADGIWRSLSR